MSQIGVLFSRTWSARHKHIQDTRLVIGVIRQIREDMKMFALTAEMKEVFQKNKVFAIATASKNAIPNVAPMATVQLVADDTIWIGDNYMVKTLANVKENPHVALYVWDPEKKRCFQIKGTVSVKTSGAEYEKIKAQIKAKGPHYPAKGLLIVKISEVYECTPGPNAGKKVE